MPHCNTTQIENELDQLVVDRRAVAVPGAQVRQRARRHPLRLGTTGVLVNTGNKYATGECWNPEHCETPTTTTSRRTRPANTQRRSPRSSARADQAAVRGPAPGLSAGAALQPAGAHPAGRVHDPGDDAPRHDHRDRPPEREGAPGGAARSSRPTTTIRASSPATAGATRAASSASSASAAWSARSRTTPTASSRTGVRSARTATRASSSASASAPTSTGCTPSPAARERGSTPCAIHSSRSTTTA